MKIKQSDLEQINKIVKDSEETLKSDVVDKRKAEVIARQLDDLITAMGNYKRFFKRLS